MLGQKKYCQPSMNYHVNRKIRKLHTIKSGKSRIEWLTSFEYILPPCRSCRNVCLSLGSFSLDPAALGVIVQQQPLADERTATGMLE